MNRSNFNEQNERDETQTEEVTGKIEYGIFLGPECIMNLYRLERLTDMQ